MYPVLVTVGGWHLQTYGVLVAAAFLIGLLVAMREARLAGEDPQRVLDLAFYVVLAAVVGGKLFAPVSRGAWFRVWEGGLSFWGGLLAAIAAAVWYMRRHRLSAPRLADLAAPALAAGTAVGELACLAAGCEYGRPSALPVALVFRDPRALAPVGEPLHPTQLYAFGWALVVLVAVLLAKGTSGERRPGQLALLALSGLALGHFVTDFFRGDPRPMLVGGYLSAWQPVQLALGFLALGLWWYRQPAGQARTAGATAGKPRAQRGKGTAGS